ncbi:MAG TPA: LuxR C-terminal-related transcriptional regulator [Anaerolineales bacterium]|nr:LuxR C-terminal-related transcriptional regulator [Anaerolineales bacterium]
MSKAGSNLTSGETVDGLLPAEQHRYLLSTKFYIPPIRSNQIARPRLTELLNEGLEKTLILVSAPAGYGKTTLVSSWLKEIKVPSAWLSLDEGDNDPIRFLQYLLTALLPISPDIEDELLGMLPGIQPNQVEDLITILVNELASVSDPFVLVLDDFHVIGSDTVLKILSFFLEHSPPQMHLVLLSRTDPPLPLSRLRVRNLLLNIRADRLRFTDAEIATFLNNVMGLTLSTADLSALESRTEGWIAGLQLAALSMQSCQDIHGFVSDFSGSHHYVMDYLVQEVLRQQSKQVGDFLLRTSILDRLCGSLCAAVVGADTIGPVDAETMLEVLEGMNLFVIPLDDERRWYRYHHLFADVLRKRLENHFPLSLAELHDRASRWYEQNGFISESIQQAIMAGEHDRAAQLIEDNGCLLLISGEVATLLNWADAIEFQAATRPWLAIQKAWAQALTGHVDRVESTLLAPEQMLSLLQPTDEVKTMLGTIAAARAYCANSQGNTRSAAKYAWEALELLPNCSSISRSIRSVATSLLGDASWINGSLEEAAHAYTEAVRIGQEANNLHMVIIANSNLADILMEQGRLHRAHDTYMQALRMAVRPDGQKSPLAGSIYAGLGRLSYESNQLDDAAQYIRQCIDLCRQWGDIGLQAMAFALLARLEQVRGNLEESLETVRGAEQLADGQPLPPRQSIQVRSALGRFWLSQGDVDRSSQLIQKSGLAIDDDIPYWREPEYVILLRLLLAKGDYEAALALSQRLLQQAETAGRMGSVIEILILQALAFQARKDIEHSLPALERALGLAQLEGYVRLFLDEGEAMTRLLCQARSRQAGSGYAAELLSTVGKVPDMVQPSMQLLIEPLTTREMEVLRLIEAGCSNQDIAAQLVISNATVKRHISNIYAKLGVKSRTQAVAIGKELRIFE